MMGDRLRVVIAGVGRIGLRCAKLLYERDHDIVLIEEGTDRGEEIASQINASIILGDATRPSILQQADLESTDVVAALTGRVGMNMAVCMEAKQMAPQIRTVARVDAAPDEYRRFVDDVVFPGRAGARMVANAVVAPEVQSLVKLSAGIEILEVEVADDAPVVGARIDEVDWPEGALIVARTDAEVVAHGETQLEAGVRYVVAVEPAATETTLHLFRG